MLDFRSYENIQKNRKPDNRYYDGAIVSWNITGRGLCGTTGIIQPGFRGEFDIPEGGEQVRLVNPTTDAVIQFEFLDSYDNSTRLLVLAHGAEIVVPQGRDRLITPAGQLAVSYLCLYPGRPIT